MLKISESLCALEQAPLPLVDPYLTWLAPEKIILAYLHTAHSSKLKSTTKVPSAGEFICWLSWPCLDTRHSVGILRTL